MTQFRSQNNSRTLGEPRLKLVMLATIAALLLFAGQLLHAQTANTGALNGTITDPSGAVVPDAQIMITNKATGQAITVVSNARGFYQALLLPPGSYTVDATKTGFKASDYPNVTVKVTETATLNVPLQVGAVSQKISVSSNAQLLDTTDAQLGTVIDSRMIDNLPLAARNYLQIISLNAGVSAELTDAGELGMGQSASAISTSGASTIDNNFQMNGVPVNDNLAVGNFSGGIPIPNPDTLQEFKVVTTPYDASNGRDAGANVDVLTKTGSNDLHLSLFEFFRNNDMNANTWFLNNTGQPRAILKQNQFGGTVGGRIVRNKLFYFGSYQGTRQRNGLSGGCAVTVQLPPLTNDRSRASLGALFAGQRGELQDLLGGVGPAILPDGSNINPVALAVLQRKLSDGNYMVPTPQTINTSSPTFDSEGTSSFSQACPFTENQYMANGDYVLSEKGSLQLRYFMANSASTQTLVAPNQPGNGLPGFPYVGTSNFKNASVTHTYTFTPTLVNQLQAGYNRNYTTNTQVEQFSWSDIGATVPAFVNDIPGIGIANIGLGGYGQNAKFVQNTFTGQDSLAWVRGRQSLRFGGDYTYNQSNSPYFQYFGSGYFLTFADFLLGLNATQNGTAAAGAPYSNEYLDLALPGELARHYRYFDAAGYVQDDIKATPRLTLNLGVRYEHLGDFAEAQGRNTQLSLAGLIPNPPASGTLQGYIVPNNYVGVPPPGVVKAGNNFGIKALGQNAVEPRVGFAWQLPGSDILVLRGGYGMYRSRSGIDGLYQGLTAPPYSAVVFAVGTQNAPATLQNPIWQTLPTNFPIWSSAAYSPTTAQVFQGLADDFQPTISQHFSLDLQTQLSRDFLLDIAYGGARSTKLIDANDVNQAALASPAHPIRGVTTNTVANVPLRVPYEGWSPAGLLLIESNGGSWYNSLQVTLSKRFSHGLQFIAAYTWVRDLTDVPGAVTGGGFGGNVYGDQNNLRLHYGPEPFVRPQRFVLSYVYAIPYPGNASSVGGRILGGWQLAGVTTAQAGDQLFAVNTSPNNAYGVNNDRPDYTPGCVVNKSGSTEKRLNDYFNTSCFPAAPVIGSDGVATAFGNAPTGNIRGPSEFVSDTSLAKLIPIKWPKESAQLRFKADFFNVFNHPVFGDPNTDFNPNGTPGTILSTVTNPRVIQLSLKYLF